MTDFEKYQPQLYKNLIYWKTCENQIKWEDVLLTKERAYCLQLVEKPQMVRFKVFTENLAAINFQRMKAKFDKPFVV